MDDILNLVASHNKENQEAVAKLSVRMQEQKQELATLLSTYIISEEPTVTLSTKYLLNQAKVLDLEYWYTPLYELQGYSELGTRIVKCLKNDNICYLGDLVTQTEGQLMRISNFSKVSLRRVKEWLAELGEEPGQVLKEYRENQALLRHFDQKIVDGRNTLMAFAIDSSQLERYRRIISVNITTVGELATSHLVETMMPEGDLQGIENYLKQWDENLHLRMPQPYRPE